MTTDATGLRSEVQRYDYDAESGMPGIWKHRDGRYVEYGAYAALAARLKAMEAGYVGTINEWYRTLGGKAPSEVRAERDHLTAELATVRAETVKATSECVSLALKLERAEQRNARLVERLKAYEDEA